MKLLRSLGRIRRGGSKTPQVPLPVRQAFDCHFYRAQVPERTEASDEELLDHYVRQGWRDGRDPAPWFSVSDYLAFHEDVKIAGVDPFHHFLAHGKAEGREAPPARGSEEQAAQWFADLFGRFVGEYPPDFDAQRYMLASGLRGANRWIALAHLILRGAFNPSVFAAFQPTADLLSVVGDCHIDTDVRKSLQCYALAERMYGHNPALKRKLGECYGRLDLKASARSAYVAAIDAGDASYASYAALGRINYDLGRFDEAVNYLGRASRLGGVSYPLLSLRRQAASARFKADMIKALALSSEDKDDHARQVVRFAVAELRNLFGNAAKEHLPFTNGGPLSTVAVLGEDCRPRCRLHDELSDFVPTDFYPLSKVEQLTAALLGYSGLIVDRAPLSPELMELLLLARRIGIPTVYKGDDLVVGDEGNTLPRASLDNLLSPADHAEFVIASILYREAMSLCDYGIASTPVAQAAAARIVRRKQCFLDAKELRGVLKAQIEEQSASHARQTILVVNIFYPPEDVGGATRVVEQIVTRTLALSGSSLSFEVLCGREYDGRAGSFERYEHSGIPVTSLSPFTDLDATERSKDTDRFFSRFVDRVSPDLIHFHCIQRLGVSLLEVAHRKNIPYLVTTHDGWWISDRQFLVDADGFPVTETGKWGDTDRLTALREALNRGAATIGVSHAQARLYEARGIANVRTIPNGSAAIPGVEAPPGQGPVWLGLLGGIGIAKGGDLLRRVLARRHFSNLRFLVIDHAMAEDSVRYELWGENQVEVRGKTSFEGVAKLYSRLHAVLAVSVCVESFGLVAREAKRLGRWVIASNRGGISEDVHDGIDGFIVDPAKPKELASIFHRMDAAPERFRVPPPCSEALRSLDEVANDYLAIYRSLLGEEGPLLAPEGR